MRCSDSIRYLYVTLVVGVPTGPFFESSGAYQKGAGMLDGRRGIWLLSVLSVVLFTVSCTDDQLQVFTCDPALDECVVASGDPVDDTTGADGGSVIVSEALEVAYDISVTDESGEPVGGLEVSYQETEAGLSRLVLNDPDGDYAPVVIYGSPDYIADLGTSTLPTGAAISTSRAGLLSVGQAHGVIEPQVGFTVAAIGVSILAVSASKLVYDFLVVDGVRAATYFDRGAMQKNEDYIEFCRTPGEVAAMWKTQEELLKGVGKTSFTLIMIGFSAAGALPEKVAIAIDATSIFNFGPMELAYLLVDVIEQETGMDVDTSTTFTARIYDWQSYETPHALLLAPIEFVDASCDPADYEPTEATFSLSHSPSLPAAGESVTVIATIAPAYADVTVEFSAVGTDGYVQEESALTGPDGTTSFVVPGGAAGVEDEYVVYAPSLGISAYDSLIFGGVAPQGSSLEKPEDSTRSIR